MSVADPQSGIGTGKFSPLPSLHPPLGSPWFAVFTHSRHEKKVGQYFTGRGIEAFVPTYGVRRRWKNRQTVTVELPLFPNYIFARLAKEQRSWALGTPGVLNIIGGPQPGFNVPEHYIAMLRTGLALGRILPHPCAEIGDRVRIIAGPLAGVEGVLAHIRSAFRVVLTIENIHQSVSIEVARTEIELISRTQAQDSFGPVPLC